MAMTGKELKKFSITNFDRKNINHIHVDIFETGATGDNNE